MSRDLNIRFAILAIGFLFTSCVGTKYLQPGEKILYKQSVESQTKVQKDKIKDQLIQNVNSKFLGMHPRVYLYHLGKNNLDTSKILKKKQKVIKKYDRKMTKARSSGRKSRLNSKKLQKVEKYDKKLKEGNLGMKWGEKLSIYDSTKLPQSVESIKVYLFSKGYFNASVDTKVTSKDKTVSVDYIINKKEPYTIDSTIYVIRDKEMEKFFLQNLEENQFIGEQYNQDLLTRERDRVYNLMTNNGYYDFKRQFILFEIDSTILDERRLVVRETIVNPIDQKRHKKFRVDSISFSAESGLRRAKDKEPFLYKDITYDLRGKSKYSPKLLDYRIFLHEDSLYSKQLTLETQKQLSYLDIFKFVNIAYDSSGGKFVANIFTSPLKKYQTSSELGLSVFEQSNGFPGPFINFNAKSRNIFGGLEIIQFDGSASIQGIQGVNKEDNYSRLQSGGQLSVTFPQFLFPLRSSIRESIGRFNPRTKFTTGVNFEDRRNEYERNTFNASMSYIWQVRDDLQFSLKPFDASYIKSVNTPNFKLYLDSVREAGGRSLVSSFESSFVSFSAFSLAINKNNYGVGNDDASYFQAYLETGGNLQNIFGDNLFDTDSAQLAYYQYIKTRFDFRKNHKLNEKSSLAYRVNLGIAYVYGANKAMPYEKYFYGGGSNSIRAWKPRRLGPGSFAEFLGPDDNGYVEGKEMVDYNREQPGDILLETSIEYRQELLGFVDYAFFLDAGNVWLWESNTVDESEDPEGDDGVFRFRSFPRQIAVGSGFGLRFDFSFLVLRFDVAYKMVDPAQPLGERFILLDYKLSDLIDFGNKAVINIGIGYPF